MPAHRVIPVIEKNPSYIFERTEKFLKNADFNVVNLECPITDTGTPCEDKKFVFKLPSEYAFILKEGAINIVTLSNNHIMDYGIEGLMSTLQILNKNGIKYTGAGQNVNDARKPAIVEKDSVKIGILAYSATFPRAYWATEKKPGTVFPYRSKVKEDIRDLREIVDFLVVSFHWGAELLDTPKTYQKVLAKFAIDNGADLVIGHHPHVIQWPEIYKGKLIFYSLGNFIFGSYSDNSSGAILNLTIDGDELIYKIYPLETRFSYSQFSPYPRSLESDELPESLIGYLDSKENCLIIRLKRN